MGWIRVSTREKAVDLLSLGPEDWRKSSSSLGNLRGHWHATHRQLGDIQAAGCAYLDSAMLSIKQTASLAR